MTTPPDWQTFVVAWGGGARVDHLAQVLGVAPAAIQRLRARGACDGRPALGFPDLFAKWHGRPPRDEEWPPPAIRGGNRGYEWQPPELTLLASLVGRVGKAEIAQVLTTRLRQVTGDRKAVRQGVGLQLAMHRIGLQATDVVGGLTVAAAGREIGSRSILGHEIRQGRLAVRRVGRLLVIDHAEWARWKASRVLPPAGYVRLASIRRTLGLRSDKLSEWARQGFIPTAMRCTPVGAGERSSKWGTWYLDGTVARKFVADRRAGRPMPWWGQGDVANLKVTWRLWQTRQHPASCPTCRQIWGAMGPPTTFEDYVTRYRPLAHGTKRHLSRVWVPGLTLAEVAVDAGVGISAVKRAVKRGLLRAGRIGRGPWSVSRTDATRWKARHCPTGDSVRSHLSFGLAGRLYGFTRAELDAHVASGRLQTRRIISGPSRGQSYLVKQQVRELRDELGFSEEAAARRVGVSVARLRVLLRGLEWRPAPRIPAVVVANAIKRRNSHQGLTIREAAIRLKQPVRWVLAQIRAGLVRPLRTKWDRRRRYITDTMFGRLQAAITQQPAAEPLSAEWLHLSQAALVAGVSGTTLIEWARRSEIQTRPSPTGRRYHRRSVKARARKFWAHPRSQRAERPAWLQAEREGRAA
jgi:hypothetical protein